MEVNRFAARLRGMRDELLQLVADSAAAAAPVELDQSRQGRLSRMDALQAQAVLQDAKRRRGERLAQIDAALARIEQGEYGWCLVCGEAIAPARLEFDPAAAACIRCASREESAG